MTAVVAVLAALLGAGGQSRAELDAIREAAFRYMFEHNASALRQAAGVYCLEIGDKDPPDEFMKRFASHTPAVKKASQCEASAGGVREKQSQARGLIFRIDKVSMTNDTLAHVEGGYFEAGLSASGNTYVLEKSRGVWKVVKDVMNWIS